MKDKERYINTSILIICALIIFYVVVLTKKNLHEKSSINERTAVNIEEQIEFSEDVEIVNKFNLNPEQFNKETFLIFYYTYPQNYTNDEDVKTIVKQVDFKGEVLKEYLINFDSSKVKYYADYYSNQLVFADKTKYYNDEYENNDSIFKYDFMQKKFLKQSYKEHDVKFKIYPLPHNNNDVFVLYEELKNDGLYYTSILDTITGKKYFLNSDENPFIYRGFSTQSFANNEDFGFYTHMDLLYKIDLETGYVETISLKDKYTYENDVVLWGMVGDRVLASGIDSTIDYIGGFGEITNVYEKEGVKVNNMVLLSEDKVLLTFYSTDYKSMTKIKLFDLVTNEIKNLENFEYLENHYYKAIYSDDKYAYIMDQSHDEGIYYILLDKESLEIVTRMKIERKTVNEESVSPPLILRVDKK